MMGYYQGKALQPNARVRRGPRPWRALARVLLLVGAMAVLAHVPWEGLRRRLGVVTEVRVEGTRYLDAARVLEIAGLHRGDDLLGVDLSRARQALLLDSRIARAEIRRRLPRGIGIRVEERMPALLVRHGTPWEIDAGGVLLQPLGRGVVADVPLLVGPDFDGVRAGTRVASPMLSRGLAWTGALAQQALQLAGEVSELDVSQPDATGLTLLDGTRVIAPAWPPSTRELSALRVVLANLKQKGTVAEEIDVRFKDMVIVRPAPLPAGESRNG